MFTIQDRTQLTRRARARALAMTITMGACFALTGAVDPAFAYIGVLIAMIASGLRYVALDEQLDRHEGRS